MRWCLLLALAPIEALTALGTPPVELYSTPGCRYCSRAKKFLRKRQVPFEEYDVSEDEERLTAMLARAGTATLPQIFIAGERIGGCSDMMSVHDDGLLAPKLEALGIFMVEPAEPPEVVAAIALQQAREEGDRSGCFLNPPIIDAPDFASAHHTAAELSATLHGQLLSLTDEHELESGGCDVQALRVDAGFAAFLDSAGSLCSLPIEEALGPNAPVDERKSFWINLYNCLVLHATVLQTAPPSSPAERGAFFQGKTGAAYMVGGLVFSLDDIEHGILRSNTPSPAGGTPRFAPDDPRLRLALPSVDPRIHFALNCGARSCPPIKVYSASRLEEGLGLASRAFLESDLDVSVERSLLTCTRLVDWYGRDFGANARSIVARLRDLLPPSTTLHAELDALATSPRAPEFEFRSYDWGSDLGG
jgi:glutaredoxin